MLQRAPKIYLKLLQKGIYFDIKVIFKILMSIVTAA